VSQEDWSTFLEVIVSVILKKKKKHICACVLFRTASEISFYSCNTADKKEILRTASNTGIYCSSDKVGTVYIIRHTFENSNVSINVPCNSCEDMACYSFGCTLTFHYSGDNLHCVIKQFVSCIHFSSVHFTLHPPP